MCKMDDHPWCSELDPDPAHWDKMCPLRPPEWLSGQVDVFCVGVSQFLRGDREACLKTLASLRGDELNRWYTVHAQCSGGHRRKRLGLPRPEDVPKSQRDPRTTLLVAGQRFVFGRDGYRCRYCGSRVVSGDFITRLSKKLDSDVFRRTRPNATTHGLIQAMLPVQDHVFPRSLGGRTTPENLVTSCYPCNYGKADFTLEQLGMESPFDRPPVVDEWDGLVSDLGVLKAL